MVQGLWLFGYFTDRVRRPFVAGDERNPLTLSVLGAAKKTRERPLSAFRHEWKAITLSALLATGAAASEAAGLILVVSLAEFMGSGGSDQLPVSLGLVAAELTFVQAAVASGALIVLSAFGRMAANYVTIRRRTEIARQWRNELVSGYLNSTYVHVSALRRGEVIETAGPHAESAAHVLEIVANLLNSVISMAILVLGAFALEPVIATILLIGGGVLLLAIRPLSKRAKRLSTKVTELDINFGNELDEMASMSKDIKLFGAGDEFLRRTSKEAGRIASVSRRLFLYNRTVPIFYQAVGLLLLLVTLAIGTTVEGTTLTTVAGAALLLLRGIGYGQQLSSFQQNLARSVPYVSRVTRLIERHRQNLESFGETPIDDVKDIELSGITHVYEDGGNSPALIDVNLFLEKPGIIGLVGPSGSGKSTLAQLLLRLRVPKQGAYLVNGLPAVDYDPEDWRRAVAFVPQETTLIHGSVADNVGFFRDWVSMEQIVACVEAVGMGDYVDSLPRGYDTLVGPTIRDFSGGQKQRIGIARALAGNPSLFVLDEPTSALDQESEDWIMQTLDKLRSEMMVVVITHRQSTLRHCDMLVHLRSGRLVATEYQSGESKNQ